MVLVARTESSMGKNHAVGNKTPVNVTVHCLSIKTKQGKFKVDKRSGRPKIITPHLRQKLVTIVTASSHNRSLPFSSLANLIGIRVSQDVIRQALHQDEFHRRVARQKPFFTDKIKQRPYDFALLHADWRIEQWRRVICSIRYGASGAPGPIPRPAPLNGPGRGVLFYGSLPLPPAPPVPQTGPC